MRGDIAHVFKCWCKGKVPAAVAKQTPIASEEPGITDSGNDSLAIRPFVRAFEPAELERIRDSPDNGCMVIPGRFQNGVVVLDNPGAPGLPEGAEVSVSYPAVPPAEREPQGNRSIANDQRRVQLPLVPSNRSGTRRLTAERVAELLDEDDLSA